MAEPVHRRLSVDQFSIQLEYESLFQNAADFFTRGHAIIQQIFVPQFRMSAEEVNHFPGGCQGTYHRLGAQHVTEKGGVYNKGAAGAHKPSSKSV